MTVDAAGTLVDSKLTVVVETLDAGIAGPATRIRFSSGSTSATVSGKLAQGVPAR